MSNQARKEKRQKERLKAAAGAVDRVKLLESEQTTDRKALSVAMDDLVELQGKYNELEESYYMKAGTLLDIEARNRVLQLDNEQLMAANGGLRTELQKVQREERSVRKELVALKAEEHDAAKLRRRLRDKADKILELQSQLSALKKEKAAGW